MVGQQSLRVPTEEFRYDLHVRGTRRLKRNLNSYTFPNARTLRSQLPNDQLVQKLRQSLKGNPPREESLEIQKAEKIPETMKPIYKMSGMYLGFISNGFLFSRDGDYLGWIDGQYVWDRVGFAANFGKENT